jgi:hypothetical protein
MARAPGLLRDLDVDGDIDALAPTGKPSVNLNDR